MYRLITAATAAAALLVLAFGASASAQAVKQMPLTQQQIQNFIAVQPAMRAVAEKIGDTGAEKPDPKLIAEMEAAVRKGGFKDFNEYDDVAANIAIVLSGIDPRTKEFTEPSAMIKKEIAEVEADKSIPADDKKQILAELNEALKSAAPIEHKSNIALVKDNFDQLDKAFQ